MGLWDSLKSLGSSNKTTPNPKAKCTKEKPKHWVGVKLTYKDDGRLVPAADCTIHNGTEVLNGGPLAAGVLVSRNIEAGSYEVSFPDIDADEWDVGP
jgi:hypothetical protein